MHRLLNSDKDDPNLNTSLELSLDLSKINNVIENNFLIYEDDLIINSYKSRDELIQEFKRINKIYE
jgi:hypothetical protein